MDLQNEVGLDPFTVYGRLIYDNKRDVNVYQAVRSLMSARGFDPGRAGYSAGELRSSFSYDLSAPVFEDVPTWAPENYFVRVMKQEKITFGWQRIGVLRLLFDHAR